MSRVLRDIVNQELQKLLDVNSFTEYFIVSGCHHLSLYRRKMVNRGSMSIIGKLTMQHRKIIFPYHLLNRPLIQYQGRIFFPSLMMLVSTTKYRLLLKIKIKITSLSQGVNLYTIVMGNKSPETFGCQPPLIKFPKIPQQSRRKSSITICKQFFF